MAETFEPDAPEQSEIERELARRVDVGGGSGPVPVDTGGAAALETHHSVSSPTTPRPTDSVTAREEDEPSSGPKAGSGGQGWDGMIDGFTDLEEAQRLTLQILSGQIPTRPPAENAAPVQAQAEKPAPTAAPPPDPAENAETVPDPGQKPGQGLLEELQERATDGKKGRFRYHAKDDLDEVMLKLALGNKDLTLEDALPLARKKLGLPPVTASTTSTPGSSTAADPAAPAAPIAPVAVSDQLKAIETERKETLAALKAAKADFDTEAEIAAIEKLEALNDRRVQLSEAALREQIESERAAELSQQQYAAAFAESARKAAEMYPRADMPNSPLAQRALEYRAHLEATGDPRLLSPDLPLMLVQWAAADTGDKPRLPGAAAPASPTKSVNSSITPVAARPLSPAAPAARTMPATGSASVDAAIDQLEDLQDVDAFLRRMTARR